jgi:hypothetical protein
MKQFCENERCENPAYREVRVSVNSPGDQVRTFCATCEEAFSTGVQHGTITAHQEVTVGHVEKFMTAAGFIVLGRNQSDPSRDGLVEAWAYQGPLDFDVATPVVFGVGLRVRDALIALDLELADPKLDPGVAQRQVLGTVTTVQVNDRELATVLGALRYHQAENLSGDEGIADQAIQDIATDGGRLKPLVSREVDQLCQRLNCGAKTIAMAAAVPSGIRRIHDLLYLDMEDGQESYNSEKPWNSDTLDAIAAIISEYIPRPE